MNIIDSLNNTMAMADLDIAIDQLNDLLNEKKERTIKWAYACCSYTRFVHVNIWRYNTTAEKVKKEVLPILIKTGKQVRKLLKENRFDEKEKEKIKYVSDNIELRKKNLEENYINGKPSDFPPADIEPKLKEHLNRTVQPIKI